MKKWMIIIFVILIILVIVSYLFIKKRQVDTPRDESTQQHESTSQDETTNEGDEINMTEAFNNKIIINIGGTTYTATLEDNETTRELVNKLPLEITMDELNGNEKYYYMTSSLPTNSKRVGNIETGDIMLYGSDCLVIFYESFNTPYSYTRIGKIDNPSSLKGTVGKDSIEVSITQ